jgi:quinol monooxygenase YgiN
MIVRVLTATVRMDRAGQFNALMRTQIPMLLEQPGLVYVKLARRLEGPVEQVVLFEEWRDPEAMYAWTGRDLQKARLVPGAEALIEDLVITHYEALDVDPPDHDWVWPPAVADAPTGLAAADTPTVKAAPAGGGPPASEQAGIDLLPAPEAAT